MLIYLMNVLSIPIWIKLLSYTKFNRKKYDITLIIIFLQLWLITSLRSISVGVDTPQYNEIFLFTQNVSFSKLFTYYLEPGYVLLNQLVYNLGGNFRILLFINSAIILIGIYKFICSFSMNRLMSLFLFIALGYFTSTMNIMRQFIALSFVLYAYHCFCKEHNFKKTSISILIASLFHSSSFIILFVFIIYWFIESDYLFSRNKKMRCFLLIGTILAFVLPIAIKFLSNFLDFINLDYWINGAGFTTNILNPNLFVKIFLICCFLYLDKKNIINEDNEYLRFFNYLNIISCFTSILSTQMTMFSRINLYFSIINIIFIPNIVHLFFEHIHIPIVINKKYITMLIYLMFFGLYFISLLGTAQKTIPYSIL